MDDAPLDIPAVSAGIWMWDRSFSVMSVERIPLTAKKILIVEEHGFSRICSALLDLNGFQVSCLQDVRQPVNLDQLSEFGLAIVSYSLWCSDY